MSRLWVSLSALVAIVPVAGCSSEAKTPPPALSPRFLAAIQRAHQAVHVTFASKVSLGMPEATFNEAVAAARAVLQEAGGEAKTPVEENAYLVLLNCFARDRERMQIASTLRNGVDPKPAMLEMTKLRRVHAQCAEEFSIWTSPSYLPPANGANDGVCLTEARKTRASLLGSLR